MGAFVTAVSCGLPIIPVALFGTRAILPGRSWLAHRGSITVIIGKAIDTLSLRQDEKSDWELALKIGELTREQILLHCGEVEMGHEQAFPPRQR